MKFKTLKKLICLTFILISLSKVAICQGSCMMFTLKTTKQFYESTSTTYFVGDEESYESLVESIWTVNPYKFVSRSKLKTIAEEQNRSDNFYYVDLEGQKIEFAEGSVATSGMYLLVLQRHLFTRIDRDFMLGNTMTHNSKIKISPEIDKELTKLYLQNLNHTLTLVKEHELKSALSCGVTLKLLGIYREKKENIKEKTVVIHESLLSSDLTADQVKANYPYPITVVSNDEYLELLRKNSADHLFWIKSETTDALLEGGTGHCFFYHSRVSFTGRKKSFDFITNSDVERLVYHIQKEKEEKKKKKKKRKH